MEVEINHRKRNKEKKIIWRLNNTLGFPDGSVVKNLPDNARDAGLILGLGRFPGEGNGNPLQYSCLWKSHGQGSLVGYSSQGSQKS